MSRYILKRGVVLRIKINIFLIEATGADLRIIVIIFWTKVSILLFTLLFIWAFSLLSKYFHNLEVFLHFLFKINKLEQECESLEPIYAGAQREALTSKLSDVKNDYDETIKAAKSKQAEKETNENKEKFDALVAELAAMLKEIARSLTEADIPR